MGFTMVQDEMVEKYGLVTAAIYGAVIRYCQMDSGTCTASQETIAKRVGITRQAARPHLKKLVDDGYLTSETKDGIGILYREACKETLQGKPNLSRNFTGTCKETLQDVESNFTRTCKETLHKDTSLRDSLRDNLRNNNSSDFGKLSTAYEKNIGVLTVGTSDILADDLEEFGLQMCLDAITESLKHNVRKWSYAQAILRNWKTSGRNSVPVEKEKKAKKYKEHRSEAGELYLEPEE